eukprot:gene24585-47949_t
MSAAPPAAAAPPSAAASAASADAAFARRLLLTGAVQGAVLGLGMWLLSRIVNEQGIGRNETSRVWVAGRFLQLTRS